MIIAGSIVGSGELIATTKVGAEAGFFLLWLILIGCGIKVLTQVELGRYAVIHGRTSLSGLNEVPGPRYRVNWLLWYWVIMTLLIITQQGGIVGGVGQALSITQPLTSQGREYNEAQDRVIDARIDLALLRTELEGVEEASERAGIESKIDAAKKKLATRQKHVKEVGSPHDASIWAGGLAIVTSILLWMGHYGLIQGVATVLVGGFTLMTIGTLLLLQLQPDWAISQKELLTGLQFRLPPAVENLTRTPVATALAAFGIIGVGAAELIMYPYWCLEKGYAKFAGPNDGSTAWLERARGWMRVMRIDAWASMAVYTFATAAFYLLGAAVLGRADLNPEGSEMIWTLAQMYVPVFGSWGQWVFLFGAIAVLYSTFFVAAAGNSRMVADGLGLLGIIGNDEPTRMKWSRWVSGMWPLIAAGLFIFFKAPAAMVLASGVAQMLMLPMLGAAALWFRYRRCHEQLKPGRVWDFFLWLSVLGFVVTAGYYIYSKLPW